MGMSDGGKGSNARPFSVDKQTFDNNWERIFGKKSPKEKEDAKAEDEAFNSISERDEPNRNTSRF
jgi:hypothetical protein